MNDTGQTVPHGTLLDVHDVGVLLRGDPGTGKSELALELLTRGHRLIADDAPLLSIESGALVGRCPDALRDLLEVRGLGILNIRILFGPEALTDAHDVDLVIDLDPGPLPEVTAEQRLCGGRTTTTILCQDLPRETLHVATGRHLAARIEAMARRILAEATGYGLERDLESRRPSA